MLAIKQWKVPYVYRYATKGSQPDGESSDDAYVFADSAEEAIRLVAEASKTGVFDWAQHTFAFIRLSEQVVHCPPLILSDRTIKMIQDHIIGSYIERVDLDIDPDLPLGRDS
jgi:hypothetical protein